MVGFPDIRYPCTINELAPASQDEATARLAKIRGLLSAALRLALDLALPPLCRSCRTPLGDGVGLCADCWANLSLIEPPYCARLGIPFTYDPGPGPLSMEAIANPPAYDRARCGALRRGRTCPGARLQIWQSARSGANDGRGWRVPAVSCSPVLTLCCRCPYTGVGCGRAASISLPPWRGRFPTYPVTGAA